jgi:cytolysin-activating lysine-acyltransferase
MTRSIAHRHIFVADLEWMVIPPIELGQFRMYRRESMPLAFASWALVSEETEKRLASGMARLAPTEWRNGDRLWLVELLAPFGNTDAVLDDLKKSVFAGRSFKLHRRGADWMPRVETIHGASSPTPSAAQNLPS